jgi:hypothetical protein
MKALNTLEMKKVKRRRNLLMELNSINSVISEVSKIVAKKTGRLPCPSDNCSFNCEVGVRYLLEEHMEESHKEKDKLLIDTEDSKVNKKAKTVSDLEGSVFLLLNHNDATNNETSTSVCEPIIYNVDWKLMEEENNSP